MVDERLGERLLIGVVTHARSRFRDDAERTASALAGLLGRRLEATAFISARDDHDPDAIPLTRELLGISARHQAELEDRWRGYLGGRRSPMRRTAMTARRIARAYGARPWAGADGAPGTRELRRLLNIDLSHLRVLDEVARSGATWGLVLEDDAAMPDEAAAAEVVAWLVANVPADAAFVSLSRSLDAHTLGVEALLAPAADVAVPAELGVRLLRAQRPVTNTVCATLYRAGYAVTLADGIRKRGLTPVAPIDWRVNEVLMDLVAERRLDERSCLWVEPAPFVQRSMHG
jgi:hypothetical protein